MKGILSIMLALALLVAPPAEKEQEGVGQQATAGDIAQAVLDAQPDAGDYILQTGVSAAMYLTNLYGLEDWIYTDAAVYAVGGVDAREIAVLRPLSMTTNAPAVVAGLEEYRRDRGADFYGYLPDQATLVENGVVTCGWGWVALLICEDMGSATAAFEGAAGQASVYRPAEGSGTGLTPADTRWFVPFDPPNKFDMSLYDTSAVLAAYALGDESGLSERDAALLAQCREILSECVTQDMTDFEKERSVYGWLTDYGSEHQDMSVHDPLTPLGQADNTNPYGVLVKGRGICLGYATTFQLLMDMAGVECVTVVGARKESRADHAWNMVCLEGEWYCVDATLDITARKMYGHYEYFNVTSAYLRSRDIQWDYSRVPESAADKFCWDGVGEAPR